MSTSMSAPGWTSRPSGLDPTATPLTAAQVQPGRVPLAIPQAPVAGRQPPAHVDTHATIPGALAPYALPAERAVVEMGPGGTRVVTGHVTVNPTQRAPDMSRIDGNHPAAGTTYAAHWKTGEVALDGQHQAAQPQPQPQQPRAASPIVPGSLRAAFEKQTTAAQQPGLAPRVEVIFDGGEEYGAWISKYVIVNTQPGMIVLIEEVNDENEEIPVAALAAAMADGTGGNLYMKLVSEPEVMYQVSPLIDYFFGAYRHTVLCVLAARTL